MSALDPHDRAFLDGLGLRWAETTEAGHVCLIIYEWPLPTGYEPANVDLLVRLPPGYPDSPLDMFWCTPNVLVSATKAPPRASEVTETHAGRSWQRFSRHLPPGTWRPGEDDLESYLGVIRSTLSEEVAA